MITDSCVSSTLCDKERERSKMKRGEGGCGEKCTRNWRHFSVLGFMLLKIKRAVLGPMSHP